MDNNQLRTEVNSFIDRNLVDGESLIVESERYMALARGKRWRPLITLRVVESWGIDYSKYIDLAVATEYAEIATIIDDDLPCMDDQNERKGNPSCHVAFGEDMALLTQLHLIAELIEADNNSALSSDDKVRVTLNRAKTIKYLVSGQKRDLKDLKNMTNPSDVLEVYRRKTGSLMASAAVTGGIIARASEGDLSRLDNFGNYLGICYQINDDIYDATPGDASLGKPKGQDKGKNTLVRLIGIDETRKIGSLYREKTLAEIRAIDGINPEGLESLVVEMLAA